jgi:uncharacterized protein with GYD domain
MMTYVVLYKFTDQGAKDFRGTVKRAAEVKAENERRGFKVVGVYWTQGQYDLISIVEALDEQAMVASLVNVAGAGNVHSETMRAFTAEEMTAIIDKV